MMQKLNTLWQVVSAASSLREIAQTTRIYQFMVVPQQPITFYLQAQNTIAHIRQWERASIEVVVKLQVAMGWRIACDQDDAGVYIAAHRRALVGNLARATFDIYVPPSTYLVLKLDDGALMLDRVTGTLHIPPLDDQQLVQVRRSMP